MFSRIHVEDIANVLEASIAQPRAGAIYNVADDEPAAPGEVVAYAAKLMGVEPPPEVAFAEADLTPMARSFYEGSRRIDNRASSRSSASSCATPPIVKASPPCSPMICSGRLTHCEP